jgi:hypothetical protein
MNASANSLAVGLLLSVAVPSGIASAADPGEQLMLERAAYWRTQHRADLAGQILGKLLSTNPSQPDALYQKGLLAREQGDNGGAQQYFDRLRQLAAADKRATELVAALGQPVITPASAAAAAPVAAAAPAPAATAATAPARAKPPAAAEFSVASADSDDLIPAKPARAPSVSPAQSQTVAHTVAGGALDQSGQVRQIAALPVTTVSDGDTTIPSAASAARSAGSADLGISAKMVQVAQVELQPPPPVGGYQLLGTLRPYSPNDTLEMNIERDLTRLEAQTNPTLIAGLGFRAHDGTQGTAQLFEVGLPIQLSFSPWYTGSATFAVIPVYLDAGSVSASQAINFGTNRLAVAGGLTSITPGSQNAGGVGLLGSYALGDFSAQLGTTPLGFPVTNVIGNLAYVPKFWGDTLSVRFEGSRQPVTDSLLSYAGTRANFSNSNAVAAGVFGGNTLWGGVVKTGGHVTAFYDDQMYGAYAGAGGAWLTGTNVAQNGVIDALLGAYFRPWKTDDWTLRVGVSLYYTGYDKNLGGYSFGQGGYFSPQDFEGLGFPIELTGHSGPWSYLASATLGVQHFNERTSPIFPNNQNAQLALQALSPSTAFLSGLHSTGLGFNLKGQLEYAVDQQTSLGVAGSFNNGNNYNEGIVQLYLRKTFDWFGPVAIKNDPQSIAARDMPASRL